MRDLESGAPRASGDPGEVALDPGAQDPYTSTLEIHARFAGEDFVPDGDLTKRAWKQAAWVRFDHDMSGSRRYVKERTRVAASWTAKYVYFAFECHFVTLNVYGGEDPSRERWELWNRDVAEVFVNPQPERVNHYYEFEVAPNNQWIDLEIDKDKNPFNDPKWDSSFVHATRLDTVRHVWTCEMRIPVASMGVTGMPPDHDWRINFFRASGSRERHYLAWSSIPHGETFHVPTRFGLLRFGNGGNEAGRQAELRAAPPLP